MRGGARLKRVWRRLPEGVRHRFWLSLAALRRATLPARLALVWRRGRPPPGAQAGIVVAGLLRDTRGVAQAARLFADAAQAQGLQVSRLDVGPALGIAPVLATPPASPPAPAPATLVSCLNPPELIRWLDAGGARALRGRRHVGYWAWELPEAPPSWARALRYVDEVWCHSEFAAGAFRKLAAGATPVHVVAPPVFMTPPAAPDRARFGLPSHACVVLAAMDLRSSAERKNPQGALAAYVRAQPAPDPAAAILVCKLSGAASDTEAAEAVRRAAAERPDIRLVTELLGDAEMAGLVATADVVVSLHRAEGFGLLPAEAAWRGVAVVTTGWSAPAEFLAPSGAALVGWTPAPVRDAQGLYGGGQAPYAVWAEPDIAEAADRLRKLIASPELRARMGGRAAAHARSTFSKDAWEAGLRARLERTGAAD